MPDEMCQGRAPHGLLQEDQEFEELSSKGLLSLEHTLAGPAQENAADRVARLAADARIVDILRADNFQGPRFQTATARWMLVSWLGS